MKVPVAQRSKVSQFHHGNDAYRFNSEIKADFSTNTWYLGPHPQLIEYLKDELGCVANYPELQGETLTAQLADCHHVAEDQILVCNGTVEAIFFIAQSFQNGASRIITPTFSEYEHACQIYNHQISYCGANFMAEGMNTREGLFWLCNPNNPTGQIFSRELLLDLLKNNPQTIFIIDEAYAEFCIDDISMVPFVGKYKNLLILKSMTKNHCLPGLRLGYLLGHQALVKKIAMHRPPWAVNSLALKAGSFCLKNPVINTDERIQYLALSRELMMQLSELNGLEVFPSSTGYFLIKTPMLAADLKYLLIEEFGLLVRDASNFRSLSDYHIRIASLTRDKNRSIVNAFKAIFE
ncbi:pyridoxal phosphate-dependent aminotransferase [Carboxylicivirga marina]|uniref:pyridoxal phosphate-dependent aminotransferase n=1 Tax=Carboxylicivirga marina TaxID=2800988 RepID=UPI0025974B12|nr:aminotransferase class I/II-fold pyridoxal phosphate-dependent enzyme [uncultured Carboxylicivirga sp.]